MKRNQMHKIVLAALTFAVALVTLRPTVAQDSKEPYPTMAPVEQYLMNRAAEITMARSAAPDAISHDATVMVLTRRGYEIAEQGKNGWVCMVGRSWGAEFDHPEFWNPKVRGAACFNPPAVRSFLPYEYKRTDLLLAGHSKRDAVAAIKTAVDKKQLPALQPGAMCYMMSKSSYLTDSGNHNGPHLMFFGTEKDGAIWGGNVTNSPVVAVNYWYISADQYPQLKTIPPMSIFLIGVRNWSDGTPAATHHE